MTIRSRLLLISILPIIMALVIVGGFEISMRQLDRAAREGQVADEIARGIYELNYLTNNYQKIPASQRELDLWRKKYRSISAAIADSSFESGETKVIFDKIRDQHRRIGELFKLLLGGRSSSLPAGQGLERQEILAGTLKVSSLEKFYDAERLVELTRLNLAEIERRSDRVTLLLVFVTAAAIAVISLLVGRTIRKSVKVLHEATQALAEGKLDLRIEIPGGTEFHALAWAFNDMTGRLRASYAEIRESEEMLRRENQERRRAEEELRQANRDLESRVAERTTELSRTNRMLEQASRHADSMTAKARRQTERQRDYDRRLEELFDLARRMLQEKSTDETLQAIIDSARRLLGARYCLTGHGFVGGRFRIDITSRTPDSPPCPPERVFNVERGGVYLDMLLEGKTLRLSDRELKEHQRWWGLPEGHAPLRGLLGVPLPGNDGPVGLIMVSDRIDGEDFTEEDERLLVRLAALAASALLCVEDRMNCIAAKGEERPD